jgi:hypothetical protein
LSDIFEITEVYIERMILQIDQVGSSDEVVIEQNRLDILTVQEQGPKGPKGDIGDGLSITTIAGEELFEYRVVNVFNNQATHADNISNYNGILALIMFDYQTTEEVIAYVSGFLTNSSWNWNEGPVYLSTSGQLTQTLPIKNSIIIIGSALNTTEIIISPKFICKRV